MGKKFFREFCIPVTIGDTVIVRDWKGDEEIGLVTKVETRYGLGMEGTRAQNPLLTIQNSVTGREKYFDNSCVKTVVKRYSGPRRSRENYFRENCQHRKYDFALTKTDKRGIICGPLPILAEMLLVDCNLALSYPIDFHKLYELYKKNGLGLVKQDGHMVWVRRKYFQKWLHENAYRVCQTTAQRRKQETALIQRHEDAYNRDYEEQIFKEYDGAQKGDKNSLLYFSKDD